MSEKIIKRGGELIELHSRNNISNKAELQSNTQIPKTKITKAQRVALRMKFAARCAYCGCELKEKGWHADHVEPVRRDFDIVRAPQGSRVTHVARNNGRVFHPERHDLENLFPACSPCNLFKATFSIEGFRKQIAHQPERAQAYSVNFRTAQRFGLVTVIERPVVFWFEVYDASEPLEPQLSYFMENRQVAPVSR
ncbi:TPA: HNH endonuclease [Raoultella planticola]|nr:HNH endonuclease [Raoultella planticola]HDT6040451.1 HNH endonuclease [Raoultella planticola]HDT6045579.1 HNH endonuclease [Raoultella planticola]